MLGAASANLGRTDAPVTESADDFLLVPVVAVAQGREISWGHNVTERLRARLPDIRSAIAAGAEAVASSLGELPTPGQWSADQVSATFGITLAADAGVILSKASAEATLEVTVTFTRH